MTVTQDQVLAYAVYEIRLLLADHLGNGDAPDPAVRAAAHLAYALHNQADAVLHGDTFDPLLAAYRATSSPMCLWLFHVPRTAIRRRVRWLGMCCTGASLTTRSRRTPPGPLNSSVRRQI